MKPETYKVIELVVELLTPLSWASKEQMLWFEGSPFQRFLILEIPYFRDSPFQDSANEQSDNCCIITKYILMRKKNQARRDDTSWPHSHPVQKTVTGVPSREGFRRTNIK